MPIIGSEPLQKNYYRLSITMGAGIVDNVLIAPDGLYSLYYIREGRYLNASGTIPKVVMDYRNPQNSYLLFDYSCDHSARRERIYFYQVQMIKDITPNSAYRLALEHGFEGSIDDWLRSLKGTDGKGAYETAVECGFVGTKEDWLKSLKGKDGKDAYELACEHGFTGTLDEWFAQFGDVTIIKQEVEAVKAALTWVVGMESK